MRRVFTSLLIALVALLAAATAAQARPAVNLGMAKVTHHRCPAFKPSKACIVRRVWFENATGKEVAFDSVGIDGLSFNFGPDTFKDPSCLFDFTVPAHGKCFVSVNASPQHVGANTGHVIIELSTSGVLRQARLVIHGIA